MLSANQAGATASIGTSISVLADSGTCNDAVFVPGSTAQDTLVRHVAASCGGGSATVDMQADAAIPSIGIRATSSGNGSGSSGAFGQVLFTDQWLLTPPAGTAGHTYVNIPVTLKLEGSVSPGAVPHPASGSFLNYNLTISDKYTSFLPGGAFSAIGQITAAGIFSQTFSGSVNFYNYDSAALPMTAVVEMSLILPGLFEGTVDFLNTASISMELPPGFSATTSSGLPLTFAQAAAPVAEPGAAMLMLMGLGLRRLLARRRTA